MRKSLMALLCVAYFAVATPIWVRDDTLNMTTNTYRGLCVIDSSTVWIVGENGKVWLRTGGVHSHGWQEKTNLPGRQGFYHFNDVFFINSSIGWIVGQCKYDTTVNDTVYKKYQGVIYKTISGGSSWSIQTPATYASNPPTPFLKVQFVDGSDGYVTCGNGIVIKTVNGGQTWTKTISDPWSDSNNESVWYDGLKVIDNQNLWVSGDAFGVLSKSTNGGDSWTSYQPDGFLQSYTFPQGAVTPYGTRLANFGIDGPDMSNVRVGLSYGKIGVCTGGTSWSVENWESQPVWFQDVTMDSDSSFCGVGNYRVVNQEGNHDHNVWDEKHYQMFNNASFYNVDISQNNIGYAVGQEYSVPYWYCPTVIQRYEPAGFVFDTAFADSPYIKVRWHTTSESNTDYWGVTFEAMNPLYRGNIGQQVDAAGHASDYVCSLNVWNTDCPSYYIAIKLYTHDPQYDPPYFLMHGPEHIPTWVPDTASRLPAPDPLIVEDRASDQGGRIDPDLGNGFCPEQLQNRPL
jgi:hypothetical protein